MGFGTSSIHKKDTSLLVVIAIDPRYSQNMHDPEKIVIFAGAGLSVPAGIPAMNSFVDKLRDEHLNPKEVRQLDAIMRDCASRASLIDSNVRNLEVLASFVSMVKFSNPNYIFGKGDDQLTTEEAEEFLLHAVNKVTGVVLNTSGPGITLCTELIRFLTGESHLQSTFITTNYDMHIEMASAFTYKNGSGVKLSLPEGTIVHENSLEEKNGYAKLIAAEKELGDYNQPRLLKLHGSVNWTQGEDDLEVHANIQAVCASTGPRKIEKSAKHVFWKANGNRIVSNHPLEWAGCEVDSLPKIFLPTILKPEAIPAMRLQWEESAKALREADQVWFIGYSFPESDSYMKYFLASCLADNTRVRQIAIIDPDRSVYHERASSVFADARLRAITNMYPERWTQLKWAQVRNQNPLYKYTTDAAIQRAELQTRGMKAHQGEYYVDATRK